MQAVGVLAGGIAHDFNNVLGGMSGFIEMSLDEVEQDSEVAENLRMVMRAGERARLLIKQILTFSRGENIEPEVLDIVPVVKEAFELISLSLPSDIKSRLDIAGEKCPVLFNSAYVHEVLMNLIANGVSAMDGGGELTVKVFRKRLVSEESGQVGGVVEPGSYIVIEVADSGTGISEDLEEKIFEPFFTTKEVGQGVGMGLSVVYGIVEKCGGNIQVSSADGQGSTFRILLPEAGRKRAEVPVTLQKEVEFTGEGTVLLVDDDELIVKTGSGILEMLGYDAVGTGSSLEALDILKERADEFVLLITDHTMPDMTGPELAVAALKIRSDLPVILSTGFSSDIVGGKIAGSGIRGVLNKPFTRQEMGRKIWEVINSEKDIDN